MSELTRAKQRTLAEANQRYPSPYRMDAREARLLNISQSYAPTEETDWSTVPTTLDQALDLLAEGLAGVSGGVPSGGTTGQALVKSSDDNYDVEWATVSGGASAWGDLTGTLSDQTDLQSALDGKQDTITASDTYFIYQDSNGDIVSNFNLSRDETFGGLISTITPTPDNGTSYSLNTYTTNIEPLQDSVNENYSVNQYNVNLDNNSSGFAFGTSGTALNVISSNVSHTGTGDSGTINMLSQYLNIGNGTDAIDVKGFGYAFGFANINADVTISGAVQGYGFQPSFDADAIIDTSSAYVNAFYDFLNAPSVEFGSYTSFSAGPTIGSMVNNSGYTGMNINPTITTFNGNSGFTGLNINGTFGTFGTGSWFGANINPSVTSVPNATGLYVNMTNVTSANKKAADLVGDVSITGNLTFSGALSIGQLQAFYSDEPVDGGGNPLTLHGLTTQMIAQDSTTVANADTIGVNTAMLIELEDNSVTTSGAFKLGFAATALPCVVKTGTGSSLDYMNMGAYALNLDATSTGGTIGRVNGVRVEAIPNGVTTINEFCAFEFNQTFGQVGTDVWGIHIVPTFAENFIGGSLAIGTSSEKVTNSSVALEIGGVTRALRHANMTSTERDALTPLAGMVVFNTTTNKLDVYDGSSWTALH